jgi:eukaryotic-like serine/threonine-protein kinase
VAIAMTSLLLAGVGGWAYVEYWSGTWYEAEERVVAPIAEAELPTIDEEIIATPEPPEVLFTAADIRDYVTSYDGGSCFFAHPVNVGDRSAEVIGYGNQRRAFDAMRNAFQARFGFDATIEMRNVTDDQCVMVDALDKLAGQGAAPVGLDLSHGVVRSGSSLSGTISGLGERHLALVMLDNFGFVHNLESYVTEGDGGASFAIEQMSTANPMDFQPQLILSVASAEPLEALDLQQSVPASEFLPTLLDEIADRPDGLASTVGYFMFGS